MYIIIDLIQIKNSKGKTDLNLSDTKLINSFFNIIGKYINKNNFL
jgi:hypothetical protein